PAVVIHAAILEADVDVAVVITQRRTRVRIPAPRTMLIARPRRRIQQLRGIEHAIDGVKIAHHVRTSNIDSAAQSMQRNEAILRRPRATTATRRDVKAHPQRDSLSSRQGAATAARSNSAR